MAKTKKTSQPKSKSQKIVSPKKELQSVRKEIRSVRSPIYAFNRKIKNAPTKYQERKIKKQKNEYLKSIEDRLNNLVEKRTDLASRYRNYETNKSERNSLKRKVASLDKKIDKALDAGDYKQVEKLRYQQIKFLGEIDKLSEKLGIKLERPDIEHFDKEDADGGEGYTIDARSPYSIWEAIKQLNIDIESESFDYFIINGKRFSSDNVIQITAEASAFWISSKKKTDGTPYVNRFLNFKKKSVKYLYFQS